jgi:hypothetical protein
MSAKKKTKATKERGPARNISSEAKWDIRKIIANAAPHIVGKCTIDVRHLVAGSKIRRTGTKGCFQWREVWKVPDGDGFDLHESFIRVALTEEQLTALQPTIDTATAAYGDPSKIGSHGPLLGELDMADLLSEVCALLGVIDGMHRTVTLLWAIKQWEVAYPDRDIGECQYLKVRCVLYSPGVKPMEAVFAKACNDQKQMYVAEDGFERITLTQQVVRSWAYGDPVRTKTFNQSSCARFFIKQVGANDAPSAVKYHSQLVTHTHTSIYSHTHLTAHTHTSHTHTDTHTDTHTGSDGALPHWSRY